MQKRIMAVIILTILFSTGFLFSRGDLKEIPQFREKLRSAIDAEKVDVYIEMAEFSGTLTLGRQLEFYNHALELARKYNVPGIESRILLDLCGIYIDTGRNKEAIDAAEKALALTGKTGDNDMKGEALTWIAVVSELDCNYDKSKVHLDNALTVLEKSSDKRRLALVKSALADYYFLTGQSNRAVEFQEEALKYAEERGDMDIIAYVSNAMATIYGNLGNGKLSVKYFQKALDIRKKLGDKNKIAIATDNLARGYAVNRQYVKARQLTQQAMALYNETGNRYGLASSYIGLGLLMKEKTSPGLRLEYLKKGISIMEQLEHLHGLTQGYYSLGRVYADMKNYKAAEEAMSKGIEYSKITGQKTALIIIYGALSNMYEHKKDYKKALEYYKLRYDEEAKQRELKISRQMVDADARHDTLKKEQRIQLLEKEKEINQLELDRQTFTRNAFIGGFILVSIILGLLFRKYLFFFTFWKKQKYISRFRLMDEIGAGGMGNVYKAHSIRDKTETVAIKVLKPELFKDESNRTRFKQEGAIVDKLNHPNIIKIFERGEYRDKLYIAMEYLAGKPLDIEILENGKMQLNRCLHVMRQTAAALALIHSKSIIHRDIKPSNIMLIEKDGDRDFVKLLDFGLAQMKFQTRITRTGVLMGTLNYMAPEQLTDSEFSLASDIYSLGLTCYEMLTGEIAFPGDYVNDILKRILDSVPAEPVNYQPELPAELNRLVMRMLDKDKDARPSIDDVCNVLETVKLS